MKHILVVEDDAVNALLFRMILEKRGRFQVTITESPEESDAVSTWTPLTKVPLRELRSVTVQTPFVQSKRAWTRDVRVSSRTISLLKARPRTTLGFSTTNSRSVEPSVTTSLRLLASVSMLRCLS